MDPDTGQRQKIVLSVNVRPGGAGLIDEQEIPGSSGEERLSGRSAEPFPGLDPTVRRLQFGLLSLPNAPHQLVEVRVVELGPAQQTVQKSRNATGLRKALCAPSVQSPAFLIA
jgi:hypothetical protein